MELLKAYRKYDLDTLRGAIQRLDAVGESKESIMDSYCPEIVYEPSMVYAQRSLKTRAFKVRKSPKSSKTATVSVNMVYRSETDTENDDSGKIPTVRSGRLFIPDTSLYGRLLIRLFISDLFVNGVTPAVIVAMWATKCPIYGHVSFVEHVVSPIPLSDVPAKNADAAVAQLGHLFDVLSLNGVILMDPVPDDFVIARFRARKSFRGLDISGTQRLSLVFRNGARAVIPLDRGYFVRMMNEFPASITPKHEHAVILETRVRASAPGNMLAAFKALVSASSLEEKMSPDMKAVMAAETFADVGDIVASVFSDGGDRDLELVSTYLE